MRLKHRRSGWQSTGTQAKGRCGGKKITHQIICYLKSQCIFFYRLITLSRYLHFTPYRSLSTDLRDAFSPLLWHSPLACGLAGQQILISEQLPILAHNVLRCSPRLRLPLLLHFITDVLAASSTFFCLFFFCTFCTFIFFFFRALLQKSVEINNRPTETSAGVAVNTELRFIWADYSDSCSGWRLLTFRACQLILSEPLSNLFIQSLSL